MFRIYRVIFTMQCSDSYYSKSGRHCVDIFAPTEEAAKEGFYNWSDTEIIGCSSHYGTEGYCAELVFTGVRIIELYETKVSKTELKRRDFDIVGGLLSHSSINRRELMNKLYNTNYK